MLSVVLRLFLLEFGLEEKVSLATHEDFRVERLLAFTQEVVHLEFHEIDDLSLLLLKVLIFNF